jgi:hypothetical protein
MALAIKTKSDGGEFQEVPKGTYSAKLVDVYDEGFREDRYAKVPGAQKLEYRFTYLLSELMSDGRPFVISEWVRIARLNPDGTESRGALFKNDGKMSNFVARVEALTGMDLEAVGITRFDDELELAEWMIGKGCLIQVGVKANGKSKVAGVMALPKGMTPPAGDFIRKKDRESSGTAKPVYHAGRNSTTLPNEPDWFTEVITVGKHKGKTWYDMSNGSLGGQRHQWCEWVLEQEPRDEGQREVQRRAGIVLEMYRKRESPIYLPPNDDQEVPF